MVVRHRIVFDGKLFSAIEPIFREISVKNSAIVSHKPH
jgi:hypothetical protein